MRSKDNNSGQQLREAHGHPQTRRQGKRTHLANTWTSHAGFSTTFAGPWTSRKTVSFSFPSPIDASISTNHRASICLPLRSYPTSQVSFMLGILEVSQYIFQHHNRRTRNNSNKLTRIFHQLSSTCIKYIHQIQSLTPTQDCYYSSRKSVAIL